MKPKDDVLVVAGLNAFQTMLCDVTVDRTPDDLDDADEWQ